MYFSHTTATLFRRFYIMTLAHCPGDHGWFSVTDVGTTADHCAWEIDTSPMFFHTISTADQLYQGMDICVICTSTMNMNNLDNTGYTQNHDFINHICT